MGAGMISRVLLGLGALLCSSCVYYDVTVERFHTLPPKGAGQTFTIAAKESGRPLEAATYVAQISQGLERYGWRQLTTGTPDYRVTVEYQISEPFGVTHSLPVVTQTGGGLTTFQGTVSNPTAGLGTTTVNGSMVTTPTYQVGTRAYHTTSYTRTLVVTARDREGREVLDTRVSSTGVTPSLAKVMPVLTGAMFNGFPGKSGSGRRGLRRG